ncbi:MAG: endonuclease domain-containing protein [Rhodospirillaceae bacterium]|nr:endonuclease domain-containing protein [Rhodospirillaceae bacterium]
MVQSASVKRGNPKRPRQLRRNATDAETVLWNRIRNRQIQDVKFRRQWPVEGYITDFCCVERMLIIEVDGGQHDESKRDELRTAKLQHAGYRVLRFWNNDVLENIEGVLEKLSAEFAANPSPAS